MAAPGEKEGDLESRILFAWVGVTTKPKEHQRWGDAIMIESLLGIFLITLVLVLLIGIVSAILFGDSKS